MGKGQGNWSANQNNSKPWLAQGKQTWELLVQSASWDSSFFLVLKKLVKKLILGLYTTILTSFNVTSASTYCTPFWMIDTKAPGGTIDPLMFDWSMWLSTPKVNAECWNPMVDQTVQW